MTQRPNNSNKNRMLLKIEHLMSTTNWHLPSIFTMIKSCAAAAADFQRPLKGVQGGEQK